MGRSQSDWRDTKKTARGKRRDTSRIGEGDCGAQKKIIERKHQA